GPAGVAHGAPGASRAMTTGRAGTARAARTAEGSVREESAVFHGHGRGGGRPNEAKERIFEGPAHAKAAVTALLAGAAVGPVASARQVALEGGVQHRRLAAACTFHGATHGVALEEGEPGPETRGGLIAREGAVVEHQDRSTVTHDGAGRPEESAGGPVLREGAVRDHQGGAGETGDGAALSAGADSLVVVHRHVGEGDAGARIEQAPAYGDGADGAHHRGTGGPAVGDGQVADLHVGRAAADAEDAAGIVAADGQTMDSRAVDGHVVGEAQLAAGQGDGAVTRRW